MIRIGQVAGESAINRWYEDGIGKYGTQARKAFYGRAMTNPSALPGLVATLSEEDQISLVWNLVRGGGIERASSWLDELKKGTYPEALLKQTFQDVAAAEWRARVTPRVE